MKFVLLMVLGIGVTVLQGACAALQGGDATTFKVTIANGQVRVFFDRITDIKCP